MSKVIWKDTGWSSVVQTVSRLGSVHVRAGVVGEKAEAPNGGGRITNGEAAIFNEFGTGDGHIPARAPVQRTFKREGGRVQAFLAEAARKAVLGAASPELALRDVGAWAESEIRRTIAEGVPPPNAPTTIALKGSDHPLIDNGDLLDAVGYQIATTNNGPTLDDGYDALELSGMTETDAE